MSFLNIWYQSDFYMHYTKKVLKKSVQKWQITVTSGYFKKNFYKNKPFFYIESLVLMQTNKFWLLITAREK